MQINFPIFNLSYPTWEPDIAQEFLREDDIYYSSDEVFFEKYFLNQEFVDCDGKVYQLVDKTEFYIKTLLFLKKKRFKCLFQEKKEQLSLEELKKIFSKRVNTLDLEESRSQIFDFVTNAKSIPELIKGL